jgi:hypothetical protein
MRKKCKRKVYLCSNPVFHAIEGAALVHGPKLDELRLHELTAIEAFRTGRATVQDWSKVVGMMNLCEHMAANGVGPEAMDVCDDAHKYLIEAAKRYEKTGKMGLSGPGLQAIRDVYEFHDLQRTSISLSLYEKFIKDTANRIRSKAPEVTDVLEAA